MCFKRTTCKTNPKVTIGVFGCIHLAVLRMHNDELHSLYSSPHIVKVIKSRRTRWAGHVARMGEGRGVYRVSVGRSKGKRPLGRPRHRWEDNIKMDLREVGIGGVNWIRLAQDRVQWQAL
jgi:hypothetical protein